VAAACQPHFHHQQLLCVCVCGYWGLHLLGRCSTTWGMPPDLFALRDSLILPSFPPVGIVCSTIPVLVVEMGSLLTFCRGCPWTTILPISASWVAGITGVSQQF
jgi:hypothetical protein